MSMEGRKRSAVLQEQKHAALEHVIYQAQYSLYILLFVGAEWASPASVCRLHQGARAETCIHLTF